MDKQEQRQVLQPYINDSNARQYELLFASEDGDLAAVRSLVENGVDLNQSSGAPLWTYPLVEASREGHIEVVKYLLDKGADANSSPIGGRTSLFLAYTHLKMAVVRLLIEKGSDVNRADHDGWTVLMLAADNGDVETVNLLIEHGADVNKATKQLCHDYNEPIPKGTDALMIAAFMGRLEVVRTLLAHGARVNAMNKDGKKALDYATKQDHSAVANLLVEKGATACIAAGTRIMLPDGREQLVETIVAGQSILAFHDGTGRLVSRRVTRVASHQPGSVVRLSTSNGDLIVTPKHRLLTEAGWTKVCDLNTGDRVGVYGTELRALSYARVDQLTKLPEMRPLHNLYVEDACTYVSNGMIAHSYVILPNLRTKLHRLRIELTAMARSHTIRPLTAKGDIQDMGLKGPVSPR